jgi:hypothetical protein
MFVYTTLQDGLKPQRMFGGCTTTPLKFGFWLLQLPVQPITTWATLQVVGIFSDYRSQHVFHKSVETLSLSDADPKDYQHVKNNHATRV